MDETSRRHPRLPRVIPTKPPQRPLTADLMPICRPPRPRTAKLTGLIVVVISLAIWPTRVLSARDAAAERAYQAELLPLLQTYCFDCHAGDGPEGELRLDEADSAEAIAAERDVWLRVLTQVRAGSMPPEDGAVLDQATRRRMSELIDTLASAVNCVQNPNAGKVALRRLTRIEYRNTIRDLTGVDYRPADDFPGDDVGYGFDNIGDVLSLPPILMEKYLDAAEAIMGRAILTPPPAEIFEVDKGPSSLIGAESFNVSSRLTMASSGTVAIQPKLPFSGRYRLTVTASGDQAGDEPAKMQVKAGRRQTVVDVPSDSPQEYTVELRLPRGAQKIELSFVNDYYVADKADRNLHIHHVHLIGQSRRRPIRHDELPDSHHELVFVLPGDGVSVEQATKQVLERFASRAFRRPARSGEINRLSRLAASVRDAGGTYEESLQVAMQAVLVSPHFLFKVEQPRRVEAGQPMPPISEYELATRISYFLWSSMPDDELLLLAHRGQLRQPKILLRKIGKMIADPRAGRFVKNFAGQWLQLRNLDRVSPDERMFRDFDDKIRELMRTETLTFVHAIMRENLPVTTLLNADFTYLNEPLAKFYGIYNVRGERFRRVSLNGTPRGGLLTHASVLTVTSNPTRTSPVKRGKWILDNLLNTPPPPAPPNIPELEKSRLVGTLRQRMLQHRENPSCAACHDMMDPLGFALENFDPVGKWRTLDGRNRIDPSGQLPDGTKFDGVNDLRDHLMTQRHEQFVRCIAEKLLTYATGRGMEYYDKCAIDRIVATSGKHDHKFAYLIAAVIASDPFQKQGYRE